MPHPMPHVVVVLPGILGSTLQRKGQDVWAVSPSALLRGIWTLGSSVTDLALKDDPPELEDLGDGITAPSLLPDLHLIPGLWKIDGYRKLTKSILNTFDVKPGENYFEFPYDWRRDNRVHAKRLQRNAIGWLKRWREKAPNAKLILIAHSMGGLISRYYLEKLEGWRDTKALITFGTPYRGSLKALNFIANGVQKKVGPKVLLDLSDLLRSLTSVYQLLPIYPCCTNGGPMQRVTEATGIPYLDPVRTQAAFEFHNEIRSAVDQHLKDPEYLNHRYKIHPIVGTHQPTLQSAMLANGKLRVIADLGGEDMDGDGTVPRVSATPIELSDDGGEMFAAEAHASLQNHDGIWVNLEGILRTDLLHLSKFQGDGPAERVRLRLALDDVYSPDEQVEIRARPDSPVDSLQGLVVNVGSRREQCFGLQPDADGWYRGTAGTLGTGTYRITVYGSGEVLPVTDVIAVM
jgi:pimeloyl-ACP methyl ester carboxylesterase